MKKQIKDSKQLLFENMVKLNPDLKLSRKGRLLAKPKLNEYERLDPPDDYWGDDEGGEPEVPSVDTADFKLHGGIENPGDYLYTVHEIKPNSEFGNIISKAISQDYGFRDKTTGIYGADFNDEDLEKLKQDLAPYMNIKSISDFIKGAEKISGEMEQYEIDKERYEGNSRDDNFREPDTEGDIERYNNSFGKYGYEGPGR